MLFKKFLQEHCQSVKQFDLGPNSLQRLSKVAASKERVIMDIVP